MASGDMSRDEKQIPHSAMYTAATWQWGKLPCAGITMPVGADKLFSIVNAYMRFYRFINPAKYSLHHTLVHRHSMINYLLEQADCPQIIEIAAGFSPRGAAVSASSNRQYYEVDLSEVVEHKRQQLKQSEQGRAVLARPNFHQLACSILEIDYHKTFPLARSFIITEGLMMYFERSEQMSIWTSIADFIRQYGGEYVFDYIPRDIEPERSRVGKLLHGIKERLGGDGQGYCYDGRTRWDVRKDLLEAGFNQVEVLESDTMIDRWGLPHADEKTHVAVYRCY